MINRIKCLFIGDSYKIIIRKDLKGGKLIMKYKVPVTFTGWGTVCVEAKNKKDLLEKLKEEDFLHELPLPDDWEYVDDSYKVDFDGLEMFN